MRSRTIQRLNARKIEDHSIKKIIEVTIEYREGGMNISGEHQARGYVLSVRPITDSGIFRTYEAFSGICDFIEPATRYSAAKLARIQYSTGRLEVMIADVLRRGGLELSPAEVDPAADPGTDKQLNLL